MNYVGHPLYSKSKMFCPCYEMILSYLIACIYLQSEDVTVFSIRSTEFRSSQLLFVNTFRQKKSKKAEEQLGAEKGGAPLYYLRFIAPGSSNIRGHRHSTAECSLQHSPHFSHYNTECKMQQKTQKITDKRHNTHCGTLPSVCGCRGVDEEGWASYI